MSSEEKPRRFVSVTGWSDYDQGGVDVKDIEAVTIDEAVTKAIAAEITDPINGVTSLVVFEVVDAREVNVDAVTNALREKRAEKERAKAEADALAAERAEYERLRAKFGSTT